MCRVLFVVGNGSEMREFVNALVKSSENDIYKVAFGKNPYHKDGWGFVWISKDGLDYYKTSRPIFEDTKGVRKFLESLDGFGVLLAHTRAASQGTVNLFNAHPLVYSSPEGFNFWFYHNGDLDKQILIDMAGLDNEKLKDISDSYVLGLYLLSSLGSFSKDMILKKFREIVPVVRTTLNTASLFITPSEIKGFVTAYMVRERERDSLYKRYSRLLKVERENLFAIVSSTFEVYSELSFEEVKNRTAFYLTIDLENEKFEIEELTL